VSHGDLDAINDLMQQH